MPFVERIDGGLGVALRHARLPPLGSQGHQSILDAVRTGQIALLGGEEHEIRDLGAGRRRLGTHALHEFGELPGALVFVGAAIIALAGLFVICRERQLGLQRARAAEGPPTAT